MTDSRGGHDRPLGKRRGVAAVVSVFALAALVFVAPVPALAAPPPAAAPPTQPLVVLLRAHVARSAPNAEAHAIEAVAGRRPLTRVATVLPVLGRGGRDRGWLRVRLPGRPNGHAGWISAKGTRATETDWRILVSLSARRVSVVRSGRTVRRFRAVVGKPSTPTPRGSFFVEEALALSGGEAGSPYALATSARSNALQEFDGGPGQIALHGTRHLAGRLGTAASHGCIRLSTRAITWLSRRIGAGVPVTVTR
jgi:lipoprotein-anchoring transpeptidase ErfK/SrfK